LKDWNFDPISSLVTVVLSPLLIYLLKIVLAALKRWGSYALEGLLYFFARLIKHSFAGALTLKHYSRLQLASQNQFLYVPSSLDVRLPIDKVFVTLNLETQGGGKGNYTEANILEAGSRIIVVGDPGSGKSSLVKWLFREACRQAINRPSRARLPVLIELKNLVTLSEINLQQLGEWLMQEVKNEALRAQVYRMDECFDSYAQTSGVLVLLDGLDEVATTDYSKIESAIIGLSSQLAQASQNNKVVLTMRFQFYQQIKTSYRDHFSSTMFLKSFTPSDIYEFLARWPFQQDATESVERIYKELTDRPTLREMCRNPLILSMYVAEDQATGSVLAPETRTDFYYKVTEELVIRRRLHQKKGSTVAAPKLREQRERILGQIALDHLLNEEQPANLLSWAEAIDIVREVMECDKEGAESFLRELAKETGLISEERIGHTFRFIHLTFCEFLAASEATQGREKGWELLIASHSRFRSQAEPHLWARLVETIPFASGLLPRAQRHSALSDIVDLGDDHLLARSFLETKLYEHESWSQFLERQQQVLLETPEEEWNEEWLQDLYLFNVVVRDATQCAQHMPRIQVSMSMATFFQSLVDKQRASLEKILSAYATQDAAAAFRLAEVCGIYIASDYPSIVISNCDQKPFFDLVRGQTTKNSEHRRLWCSLLAEAALRSRVVAQWMNEIPAHPDLATDVKSFPKVQCWHRIGLIEASFLTQCITVARNQPARPELVLVNELRRVESPGSTPLLLTRASVIIFFVTSPIFPFLLIKDKEFAIEHGLRSPALMYLPVFFFFYFLVIKHTFIKVAYKSLLQIRPQGPLGSKPNAKNPITKWPFSLLLAGKRLEGIKNFNFERKKIVQSYGRPDASE
jgi:hypothetical protein